MGNAIAIGTEGFRGILYINFNVQLRCNYMYSCMYS